MHVSSLGHIRMPAENPTPNTPGIYTYRHDTSRIAGMQKRSV